MDPPVVQRVKSSNKTCLDDRLGRRENEPRKVARMTSTNCRREDETRNATTTPKKSLHLQVVGSITLGAMALLAISTTGCYGVTNGYNIGLLGYPLPVSPYYQHKAEENFWKKERYEKVPILGPTTSGGPAVALDPPTRRRGDPRPRISSPGSRRDSIAVGKTTQ